MVAVPNTNVYLVVLDGGDCADSTLKCTSVCNVSKTFYKKAIDLEPTQHCMRILENHFDNNKKAGLMKFSFSLWSKFARVMSLPKALLQVENLCKSEVPKVMSTSIESYRNVHKKIVLSFEFLSKKLLLRERREQNWGLARSFGALTVFLFLKLIKAERILFWGFLLVIRFACQVVIIIFFLFSVLRSLVRMV